MKFSLHRKEVTLFTARKWPELGIYFRSTNIQLFRERLSQIVHATITKGIVGGFEFAVLQRNLKEWHNRPWTYVCAC